MPSAPAKRIESGLGMGPRIHAGLAAILGGTLLAAIIAFVVRGADWLTLGLAAGGELLALVWLVSAWVLASRRPEVSWNVPPVPAPAAQARTRRLAAQLRDVRNAADALPDALALLDHQGRMRWHNAAATHLLGILPTCDERALAEQLAGSKLGAWLGDTARQPVSDLPSPVDPSLRLSATTMPFGAQWQLLLVHDISALSRLEQVRRDFVANVSHELRTPLTVIHGYLELLDPDDAPEFAPIIKEMRQQSQRMGQIVEDLLTLSRLEGGEALPEEHVAMAPLLLTLRREAEALSQGRHTITIDASTDTDLRGSAYDLHSAFSNLVSNAVRYTPSGGNIVIGWQRTASGEAAFSVSDSGLGIPPEHLSRLTERFYRVSSSRSRGSGGTGLGLSIVKHVLNLHQARLQIESEPGRGSTFTCVLDASRLLQPDDDDGIDVSTSQSRAITPPKH